MENRESDQRPSGEKLERTFNAQFSDYDLHNLRKRLRQYKKRYASAYQRKLKAEQAGRQVHKSTLKAIENNREWIDYYQTKIAEHEKHALYVDGGDLRGDLRGAAI